MTGMALRVKRHHCPNWPPNHAHSTASHAPARGARPYPGSGQPPGRSARAECRAGNRRATAGATTTTRRHSTPRNDEDDEDPATSVLHDSDEHHADLDATVAYIASSTPDGYSCLIEILTTTPITDHHSLP